MQVLFTIPIFGGIKVFGYGAMLVLAFIGSTWLATWRARREKLDPDVILDMAFWIFFIGLVGCPPLLLHPVLGRRDRQPARRGPVLERRDRLLRRDPGRIDSPSSSIATSGRFRSVPTSMPWRRRSWSARSSAGSAASSTAAATATPATSPGPCRFPSPLPPGTDQFAHGLIPARGDPFPAAPPDPALLGPRRPGHPHPALGLSIPSAAATAR